MKFIEAIILYITAPAAAVRDTTDDTRQYPITIVCVLAVTCIVLSAHIISGRTLSASRLTGMLSLYSLSGIVLWFVFTSMVHFGAEMAGGKGSVSTLGTIIGFSLSPFLLVIPVSCSIMFIGYRPGMLFMLSCAVLALWAVILFIYAVSHYYRIRKIKACLLILSPVYLIPLFFIILIMTIISIVFMVGGILS